ncbi:hypothetical protein E8E15_011137 [Penicillium rubens]|jgi:hypothetical protein|uniref:Pc22g04750 protein n=2 Tax=Penicillium chrysogenum species complex TaxID=254878 RepID=B6HTH8_PENRW|nr:uncharacterized protein N7525_005745 [Penicillium rubens]KZN85855.1 hypothetical protein EN45_100510 [Penicillium chrysogenum]CAP97763.1 Pc22g04750 [Penicillium rubens Wisconsin 54-1255]KAF3030045.1 hypothetical protein E8E15_011137 [Penicillium rubens]KAJ5043622.1 hypothetical protein NUH16_000411 [Penicillium rubens]KAJ5840557.1 hypothetical protein N7525_005745 [Penicillium rubens]
MAYNAVAQVDHEVASISSASASRTPSPAHGHVFEQLPLDTDHIGGGSHLEAAKTTDNPSFNQLGSMIRSMTSTSYDVVEDDDYDADPSPEERSNSLRIPPLNTTVARHSPPEPPIHSACSEASVPLSHPTPDLQSIQGAYKGNVTRLEQSAEQLSSCSADIESEIRRIDQEQKRRSVSSASNSIIHRNGAFSPARTVSSAHGSNMSPARQRSVSGARLAQLSEPALDEREHEVDEFPGLPNLPPSQPLFNTQSDYHYDQYVPQGVPAEAELERRASVASNDTYQQARTLFTDFDGVHFTPLEPGRQVSLEQPPLARKPEHYKQPQAGENMVFYPAPVPRMLNLPPKLSRKSNMDRDKRRTQLAGAIAAEDRKSTAVLPDADQTDPRDSNNDKRKSAIPPHLRASVFFDQPSTSLQIEVEQESAVATLESILDASANAPVSAFTDHPYAGQVGGFIYKSKRKTLTKDLTGQKANRISRAMIGHTYSTNNVDEDGAPVASRRGSEAGNDTDRDHDEHGRERGSEGTDAESDEQSEDEDEEDEEDGELDYIGPPNTLIAELELRKHELKHRRRTAVPVPFQGMQTTLLEMDEMVQKQSDKRRQRPVALAWEGRDEDEDVPLAMLYPEKAGAENDDRPLGLLAKRQQEENEPLSSRRARLRGEPIPQPEQRPATVYAAEPPAHVPEPTAESEEETEIETLAERLQRLKGHNRSDSKFASDLMAEIDSRAGIAPKAAQEVTAPDEEETLAQRRSRLQKEAAAQSGSPKNPRMRRSMAALTQGRPSHLARQSSHGVFNQRPATMSQYGNRMSMQQFPTQMGYPTPAGYPMAQQYGYPMGPAMMGTNGVGYAPSMAETPGPVKTEVINRWRQSIR